MPGDTPMSFDAALAALDVDNDYAPDRGVTYQIVGLDAVRAAHRAEVERAVREAVEQERAACAFASIDVIRAVMRELDEFSKGEVAENGYIDEGDDDGTGHTPFRNGWTLYGFARNEMCGVLTKVPAAIRARGVAKRTDGEPKS